MNIPAEDFALALSVWFAGNKRLLPFRVEASPYRVWISEILGQQTRMTALLPYYQRFIARFPDIQSLAAAEEEDLLGIWAGLGYYARARALHKAAKQVASVHGGILPADFEALLALPGIGDYTAGAIASIAFGLPTPAVDGNVRRVAARLAADNQAQPKPWLRTLMEYAPPVVITEGMMELGALVCIPRRPRCDACPVQILCRAYAENSVDKYPLKTEKPPKREEYVQSCLIFNGNGAVLWRRRTERLLGGMWELPSAETLRAFTHVSLEDKPLSRHRHVFTHIVWHMTLHNAEIGENTALPPDYAWFPPEAPPTHPAAFAAFAEAVMHYEAHHP